MVIPIFFKVWSILILAFRMACRALGIGFLPASLSSLLLIVRELVHVGVARLREVVALRWTGAPAVQIYAMRGLVYHQISAAVTFAGLGDMRTGRRTVADHRYHDLVFVGRVSPGDLIPRSTGRPSAWLDAFQICSVIGHRSAARDHLCAVLLHLLETALRELGQRLRNELRVFGGARPSWTDQGCRQR